MHKQFSNVRALNRAAEQLIAPPPVPDPNEAINAVVLECSELKQSLKAMFAAHTAQSTLLESLQKHLDARMERVERSIKPSKLPGFCIAAAALALFGGCIASTFLHNGF